jgi:hypothetical protein
MNTAMVLRKAIPLNNAYIDANSFPEVVYIGVTGPIPVRIMEAFKSESIQDKSAK